MIFKLNLYNSQLQTISNDKRESVLQLHSSDLPTGEDDLDKVFMLVGVACLIVFVERQSEGQGDRFSACVV